MLPTFTTVRARRRAYLKVTCPRPDCGNSFWVHGATWHTPTTQRETPSNQLTRPCPFCFRASWVPPLHPHTPRSNHE